MVGGRQDRTSPRLVVLPGGAAVELAAAVERCWAAGDAVLVLPPAPAEAAARMLARWDPDGPVEPGTAAVVATSGSTGSPKAAELTHRALEASARASLDRLDAGPGDRWLCCVPLHHVAGLQVLVRSRLLGTPPVVHPGFDPSAVGAQEGVTMVALVPTMLHRLLEAGVDLRRFRTVLLGGAPPPAALLDRAGRAGVRVVESYGMTETAGGCVYDGVPLDGVSVRLATTGRVEITGPVLMARYRNDPERTAGALRGGWLRTGDVGAWDSGGRLRVLGRADDVIVTGGEKVAAGELADLLRSHPAVAEALVYGMPDPEWGQRVVARVVAVAGPPSADELRAFVRARAEPFKVPAVVEVEDCTEDGPRGPRPDRPGR